MRKLKRIANSCRATWVFFSTFWTFARKEHVLKCFISPPPQGLLKNTEALEIRVDVTAGHPV